MGGTAGALGAFMLIKRMALVGDALTHVALPGMGLALLWGYDPFIGAFASLSVAVICIWWLRGYTKLPFEALVGILFTGSLAVGVLIIPDAELMEALFGDITSLHVVDGLLAIVIAIIILLGLRAFKSHFIITTISEDVARASGISVSRTDFIYLLLVACLVALGVKFVGALLMGALVIIPAASAQNVARSFSQYISLSVLFGVVGALAGVLLHFATGLEAGPLVVLASAMLFLVSFIFKR